MSNANSMRNLCEDVITSHDARMKFVRDMTKGTSETLKGFHRSHQERSKELQEMINELKKNLAHGESARLGSFKAFSDIMQTQKKEREDLVADMLQEMQDSHQEMGNELRSFFGTAASMRKTTESMRVKDFKVMISDLQKKQAEREKEVKLMLGAFRAEREGMANAWQGMVDSLNGRHTKTKKSDKAAKPEIKKTEAKIKEVEPEANIRSQILNAIADVPGGMKLTNIGQVIGEKWQKLTPYIKELVDEEKINRIDDFYYLSQ